MKPVRIFLASLLCLTLGVSNAFAHDLWLNSTAVDSKTVRVEIGYGHSFPNPEPIPEKRLGLFTTPKLITPQGEVALKQSGENYSYTADFETQPGSYLAVENYKPTFWTNGHGGWEMNNRTQRPDAKYCELVSMHTKNIWSVGGDTSTDVISKPVNAKMEFVPLVHPSTVKPGQKFPVKVLVNGKPASTVEVKATFAGFSDENCYAFTGHTNLQGVINIIPLKAGRWFAITKHTESHNDLKICDETMYVSTLTFQINE